MNFRISYIVSTDKLSEVIIAVEPIVGKPISILPEEETEAEPNRRRYHTRKFGSGFKHPEGRCEVRFMRHLEECCKLNDSYTFIDSVARTWFTKSGYAVNSTYAVLGRMVKHNCLEIVSTQNGRRYIYKKGTPVPAFGAHVG